MLDFFLDFIGTVVVCVVCIFLFMLLSGKLSAGGSRGREWSNQAEQNARRKTKNIQFTRTEVQKYANKYYNKK